MTSESITKREFAFCNQFSTHQKHTLPSPINDTHWSQ